MEKIKALRQEMKDAAEDAKAKDALLKDLAEEYKTMNKKITRSSYTKRILEIVRNIQRQKDDIAKVWPASLCLFVPRLTCADVRSIPTCSGAY